MHIMNLTLKLKIFEENVVIKDIKNDDDNEENNIGVDNKMKNNNCKHFFDDATNL